MKPPEVADNEAIQIIMFLASIVLLFLTVYYFTHCSHKEELKKLEQYEKGGYVDPEECNKPRPYKVYVPGLDTLRIMDGLEEDSFEDSRDDDEKYIEEDQ